MKKDVKERWVGALRSGIYKQGHFELSNADGVHYCCLGVLCATEGLRRVRIGSYNFYYFSSDRSSCLLLPNFMDAIGLSNYAAGVLTRMNDADKKSFDEIADWIEENL